ncbi:MAG: histidinol-phosphatase [Desulfopila sp.]|jgi:histidinol-phosphatase (PHP family)|nr:histidinol-phosphatase [Desulfopila sp.]
MSAHLQIVERQQKNTVYGNSPIKEDPVLIDSSSDGHVHTTLCHHAVGEMEEYVLAAISKNLSHICFLEHMEEGIVSPRITWLTENDFDIYFAEGERLREKYSASISIGLGVEVGFNPQSITTLQQRLAARQWDRIGISYHFHRLHQEEHHLNLVGRNEPRISNLSLKKAAAIEEAYYTHLIKGVETLPGTVVCHIDAVLRHYPSRHLLEPPWHLIEELLDKVKERGMSIEVNTSGIAIRGEVFPSRKIVQKAIHKGIPLSASSDAHRPEDVGFCFHELETISSIQ